MFKSRFGDMSTGADPGVNVAGLLNLQPYWGGPGVPPENF